eukprot:746676-Hanusia_phi.AAC.10
MQGKHNAKCKRDRSARRRSSRKQVRMARRERQAVGLAQGGSTKDRQLSMNKGVGVGFEFGCRGGVLSGPGVGRKPKEGLGSGQSGRAMDIGAILLGDTYGNEENSHRASSLRRSRWWVG